jgi:hypothetical protein
MRGGAGAVARREAAPGGFEPIALYSNRPKITARNPDRDELSRRKTGDQNAPAMISRRHRRKRRYGEFDAAFSAS